MCSVCLQMPCHPRCPNAPEPVVVYNCSNCGEGILDGDEYVEIDGKYICMDCLDNMTTKELLETCGYEVETAEVDCGW